MSCNYFIGHCPTPDNCTPVNCVNYAPGPHNIHCPFLMLKSKFFRKQCEKLNSGTSLIPLGFPNKCIHLNYSKSWFITKPCQNSPRWIPKIFCCFWMISLMFRFYPIIGRQTISSERFSTRATPALNTFQSWFNLFLREIQLRDFFLQNFNIYICFSGFEMYVPAMDWKLWPW